MQGALYMLIAAFFFSVMNTLVRVAASELPPIEIAFFRNFFALVAMMPWFLKTGLTNVRSKRPGLQLTRALVGIIAMGLWFTSLSLVPLTEAVALNFTLPLFVVAGAALLLKEDVGVRRWGATAIGFIGMLVIIRPGFMHISLATLLPIISAVFMAMSMLTLKMLSDHDSPGTSVFYMNFLMTLLSFIPAIYFWQTPGWTTLGAVALLGAFGTLAHLSLARAYRVAEASAVMPFDYARLPFIALFSYFLFGEIADIWTWIGAAIIAGSAFYIARREVVVAKQKNITAKVAETPLERQ
jgi:drug/metabolite transporter (DMT)-like permease